MHNTKVAILLLNTFTNDSRVLKEATSLSKHYNVTIFALNDTKLPLEEDLNTNLKVLRNVLYKRPKLWIAKKTAQLIVFIKYLFVICHRLKPYDIIHCNDLETLPFGMITRMLFNHDVKIVYDAHEHETETLSMKGLKKVFARAMERFLIKYADEVIAVSPSIADDYSRIYRIKKPQLILNCPPAQPAPKTDLFRAKFNLSDETIIFLYQGGLSGNRGIENILYAFLESRDPFKVIVFMGYGPLADNIRQVSLKTNNIFYHPAVAPSVLHKYTSSADVGLLLYENNCLNHLYCLPNKIFEYFMANLPVAASNLLETSGIIKKYNAGYVLDSNTKIGISDLINQVSKKDLSFKRSRIPEINSVYNWENQEKELLNLYANLCCKSTVS